LTPALRAVARSQRPHGPGARGSAGGTRDLATPLHSTAGWVAPAMAGCQASPQHPEPSAASPPNRVKVGTQGHYTGSGDPRGTNLTPAAASPRQTLCPGAAPAARRHRERGRGRPHGPLENSAWRGARPSSLFHTLYRGARAPGATGRGGAERPGGPVVPLHRGIGAPGRSPPRRSTTPAPAGGARRASAHLGSTAGSAYPRSVAGRGVGAVRRQRAAEWWPEARPPNKCTHPAGTEIVLNLFFTLSRSWRITRQNKGGAAGRAAPRRTGTAAATPAAPRAGMHARAVPTRAVRVADQGGFENTGSTGQDWGKGDSTNQNRRNEPRRGAGAGRAAPQDKRSRAAPPPRAPWA
jgi:hypothetical protein